MARMSGDQPEDSGVERAADAVDRRIRAEPVDPGVCEREPIHVPGAVQSYAVLLACDPASLRVRLASANVGDVLEGARAALVVGRTLDALLPATFVERLRGAQAQGRLADPGRPLRDTVAPASSTARVSASAHVHDGRLLLELEPLAERAEGCATPQQAQDAVADLRAAPAMEQAADAAARDIRAMTGFERVLVYRFDADWNGEAVAESLAPDWSHSLMGLRFPASDIPAQARALYTRSPARFVADRDAAPAALLADPEDAGRPVDLTYAHARALSPIHLEYQRNLGVNGSMSASILVEGRLWGLVIGHHRHPHYVPPDTRALAALVTDAFALRVHELESVRLWREQQTTMAVQNALLERMAASDDFVAALADRSGTAGATLLDLFAAGGAAVVEGDLVARVGETPDEADVALLAAWLRRDLPAGERVFATAELSAHHARGEALRARASGVLAAFVGVEGRNHLLIWFRPEVASTVAWGGDPTKTVLADTSTRAVLPRRSFERWVEERRGQAETWEPWQLGAAGALAAAVEGVALRQGRRIAELTAREEALTRALEQKDVLAREIDHRVKNSLQIVAGVMLMQARGVSDPVAKAAFEDTYARVMSVARVHDSLQQSEDVESVDLGRTVSQLCGDLSAGMTGADQALDVQIEQGLMVSSRTAVALSLIATELVTNALKYAYGPGEAGRVEVSVKAAQAGGVELRICDEGRGLPADWSSERPKPASGGGLGMRVIRAMLQQIGAEMVVESDRRRGACFTVRA